MKSSGKDGGRDDFPDGDGGELRWQITPACHGILASFDDPSSSITGSSPIDNLILSSDGTTLFGMTQSAGCNDTTSAQDVPLGTVFWIPAEP